MIKPCKWCGKKQEMNGKREFCPGDKCKNAWKYARRTGKTGKREIDNDNQNVVKTLIGQLTKVTTTADQCLRVQVDIPFERVTFDTIKYLNQKIVIGFVNDIEETEKKEEHNPKDRFFN